MTIRFQHLLDSQTEFKIKRCLLNPAELAFVQNLNGVTVAAFYFISHDSYLSIGHMPSSGLDYFDNHRYIEFTPSVEPTLSNEQIFIMFLKKHRMYSAYKRNLATLAFPTRSSADVVDFLSGAFSWTQSPEGITKWAHLGNAWSTLVVDLNLTTRS